VAKRVSFFGQLSSRIEAKIHVSQDILYIGNTPPVNSILFTTEEEELIGEIFTQGAFKPVDGIHS
jgi:hypothetical protein